MHENNPFQNIKDYWGSYYSSITESAEKHLADFAGYAVYKDGKWYQSEGDVKRGKGISSDELWNRHGDEYKRHLDSRKGANEDKDSRDGESTRSEEVEHDGEQLHEIEGRRRPYKRPTTTEFLDRLKKQEEVVGERPDQTDWDEVNRRSREHARAELMNPTSRSETDGHLPGGAAEALKRSRAAFARPLEPKKKSKKKSKTREESLFHKDSDRLLREHIRAEYEARGIYPTSREVQETYNMVMDLLEKTRASKRDAILAQQHGTSGTKKGLELTKQELRRIRAGNSPQDYGDPARTSREEGQRQAAHRARRNKLTRISPSSPAREQDGVEIDTRFLMGQGFSPSHLRRRMSDTGR
jgi:hypothetical protein